MKVLSLWEPWASFIAKGRVTPTGLERKTIETRTRPLSYKGPLAIHAALKIDKDALRAFGMSELEFRRLYGNTPGSLVCVVNMTGCRLLTEQELLAAMLHLYPYRDTALTGRKPRYGYHLTDIRPTQRRVVVRGYQGLFNISDELARLALESP